jgi:Concanavalin A-like lectin/glucanases superfamily
MNRGMGSILAGIVVAVSLLFASSAGAATLVADYQFQGTTASSGPGPELTVEGLPAFPSENVMGTTRQVLSFPQGAALRMAPAGVANDYSAVMTFRFDLVDGYRRILDASNGDLDEGLYVHDGTLDYYDPTGNDNQSVSAVLSPNTYATIALVVNGSTPLISGYINGSLALQFAGPSEVDENILRFFKDDGSSEESGGAVSCIRVFSGALSDAEVASIGASASCQAPPAPVVKKKCKKHKKKHRAAEAKKKCKKHKKKR